MAKKAQAVAEEAPAAVEKKGGSKILIIVLVLLVIGAGSFGGVYLFLNKSTEEKPVVETKVEILKEVTVNLDEGGYLKTSLFVSFDEDNSKVGDEITAKTVEIQDKAIFYLKSRKYTDFAATNEEKLKKELIAQINSVLSKGELVNVYFPAGLMVQK